MTGRRILVISPRTWGQFGNYLAATRLAGVVQGRFPDDEVTVWEAEATLPWVGEIGERIKEITVSSPDVATRTRRYLALMAEVEAEHPRGFEDDPTSPVWAKVAGLRAAFEETRPDLVIGTKGFVARLCLAAVRRAGLDVPVVGHVTNPGLLDLPIHRSTRLDAVFVPYDWARQRLLADEGGDPGRVHVVGPLVAQHDLGSFVRQGPAGPELGWPEPDTSGPRPRIILFSNRGGDDYLRILRHLAARHPETDVVFVGYDDPALVAAATAGAPSHRWRFHTRLTQAEYFAYIRGAGAAEDAFLISKSGPNTTLEAAYFGIPVLMMASGLPMEGWVTGLIEDRGLGRCCDGVGELLAVLDGWLADRRVIHAHKTACRTFAEEVLDQEATAGRIEKVVRELLDRRRIAAHTD